MLHDKSAEVQDSPEVGLRRALDQGHRHRAVEEGVDGRDEALLEVQRAPLLLPTEGLPAAPRDEPESLKAALGVEEEAVASRRWGCARSLPLRCPAGERRNPWPQRTGRR